MKLVKISSIYTLLSYINKISGYDADILQQKFNKLLKDNKWHLKQSAQEMAIPPPISPPHTKTTTNHEPVSSNGTQ